MRSKKEIWSDLYAEGGTRTGVRCPSHPTDDFHMFQCSREKGHEGRHRHTSSADGRSISWEDDGKVLR